MLAVFAMACTGNSKVLVEVENTSSSDRQGKVVEVEWSSIDALKTSSLVVLDDKGTEIPSQIIYQGEVNPQSLIFEVDIPANSKKTYSIQKGVPAEYTIKTFGRQIPERKDDFAWENDRVVFRVYGPALANENPSNGVDLWLKKTPNMIVNKFYKGDLEERKSYHVDHGEGLDCYKVGHTLGAGAIAPFLDNQIWVGNHYTTARVLDSGALRTYFELTYDAIKVADKTVSAKVYVSLDAGSQFNKAVVYYSGDFETIDLAAGIFLHNELGEIQTNTENGTVAYAENAVSDAGVPAGRNYVGVVFTTPVKEIFQDAVHVTGITSYKMETPLEYYFGGGWSQWGFESDSDWFEHVEDFSKQLKTPLIVTVKEAE